MDEEKPNVKSLKLKDSRDTGRSDLLNSALKRLTSESPDWREKGTPDKKDKENSDRNDKVLSKGKEPLQSGNQDPMRSSMGKSLVKVGNDKVANKGGKPLEKQEARVLVEDEVKLVSKEGKVSLSKEQGKSVGMDARKVNGKEQGKELGKVNGKDSGGVRDLIKVKDEDRDLERGREKGKSPVAKSALVRTEVKLSNASKVMPKSTKMIPSSTNAGASSSLGQSLKKKVMQTKTMTTTTMKTVMEQKEKRVYALPGQKHDPPKDRDPLRIFYSTLRVQMPENAMAEFWLMEYGLLPQDEAKKALERKQRRGQSLKHGTPSKSSTSSRLSNGSLVIEKSTLVSSGRGKDMGTSSKGKNKRDDYESDSDDDDFLLKTRIKKKLKA